MAQGSEIFDRVLLHERRRRLALRGHGYGQELPDFLLSHAVDDICERLAMIKRSFRDAVTIGSYHGLMAQRLRGLGLAAVVEVEPVAELMAIGGLGGQKQSGVVASEEALPFKSGAFDLAVSVLSLQYVNDLPGVLAQIRSLLRPDGLFIGVVLGGATLRELRQTMLQAEAEVMGGASPRVMPFIDVRDAGGLLQRAGFALPVADVEMLSVTYANALDLCRELKLMGATNVLQERSRVPMTRGLLMRAAEIYAERFAVDDGSGRIAATFELVTMTGWFPDASQQQPLKPGSAQMSLADALGPRVE